MSVDIEYKLDGSHLTGTFDAQSFVERAVSRILEDRTAAGYIKVIEEAQEDAWAALRSELEQDGVLNQFSDLDGFNEVLESAVRYVVQSRSEQLFPVYRTVHGVTATVCRGNGEKFSVSVWLPASLRTGTKLQREKWLTTHLGLRINTKLFMSGNADTFNKRELSLLIEGILTSRSGIITSSVSDRTWEQRLLTLKAIPSMEETVISKELVPAISEGWL
jgi:hypothetical protein